jgi:hypothetical protein
MVLTDPKITTFATKYLGKLLKTYEFSPFLQAIQVCNQFSDEQSSHPTAAPHNLLLGSRLLNQSKYSLY